MAMMSGGSAAVCHELVIPCLGLVIPSAVEGSAFSFTLPDLGDVAR